MHLERTLEDPEYMSDCSNNVFWWSENVQYVRLGLLVWGNCSFRCYHHKDDGYGISSRMVSIPLADVRSDNGEQDFWLFGFPPYTLDVTRMTFKASHRVSWGYHLRTWPLAWVMVVWTFVDVTMATTIPWSWGFSRFRWPLWVASMVLVLYNKLALILRSFNKFALRFTTALFWV